MWQLPTWVAVLGRPLSLTPPCACRG